MARNEGLEAQLVSAKTTASIGKQFLFAVANLFEVFFLLGERLRIDNQRMTINYHPDPRFHLITVGLHKPRLDCQLCK